MRYFKYNNSTIIEHRENKLTEAELSNILGYATEISEAEYQDLVRTAKENYEKSKTSEQKIKELEDNFIKNKNELISYINTATLQGDLETIRELQEEYAELQQEYIKAYKELINASK